MVKLEKTLMKQVIQQLDLYQHHKVLLWWGRLQSLKVRSRMGHWIQGCPKGTPDFLALMRNQHNGITGVFIETKSDTGVIRPEQLAFMQKYKDCNDIQVLIIRDISELKQYIDMYGIDTMLEFKNA